MNEYEDTPWEPFHHLSMDAYMKYREGQKARIEYTDEWSKQRDEFRNKENPYQQYIKPPPNKHHVSPNTGPIGPVWNSLHSALLTRDSELWRRVKQVWEDCKALGWDEEDTAEALFGIVEELMLMLDTELL